MAPLRIKRPRWAERVLAPAIEAYLRVLAATCRLQPVGQEEQTIRNRFAPPYILAFWHNRLAVPAWHFRLDRPATLIGRHADGDLITKVIERLGLVAIRGGPESADAAAAAAAVDALDRGQSVGLTPDGPSGPCYRARPGAIFLASRSGAPIIPFACSARPRLEFRSWDRFQLPLPWSSIRVSFGEPFTVPRFADRQQIERWRRHLERSLGELTALVDGEPTPDRPQTKRR